MTRISTALTLTLLSQTLCAQVAGRFGEAFKAADNYAAASPNPVYTVMPLTVECWAKLRTKSAYNILAANEPKNSVTHWEIYADKSTGHFAAFLPAYSTPILTSNIDIVDGKWHYLALTCDGQTARLFVDAKEAASAKLTKKFSYPDVGPLTFGHIEGVDTTKDAIIDELRISRIVRTIDKTPAAPFNPDADTVGLWHFDGDGKSGYPDVSTTKNPARLVARHSAAPETAATNRWAEMDTGPFFTSTLQSPALKNNIAYKGISVRLAKGKSQATTDAAAAICFDPETLRVYAGWTDGFVKIYPAREGLAQPMDIAGKIAFYTQPGPGWAIGENPSFEDPRPDKLGPVPADQARYNGLYLSGDRVIFSYTIGKTSILESHDIEKHGEFVAFTRTLEIGPSRDRLTARIVDLPDATGGMHLVDEPVVYADRKDGTSVIARYKSDFGEGVFFDNKKIGVTFEPHDQTLHAKILIWSGARQELRAASDLFRNTPAPINLAELTKGGPPRWGQPLTTKGKLATPTTDNGPRTTDQPYVVDTLTPPEKNPFNSYLRFSGLDFFKNGDMAICSISGDVWIVSGIDDKLDKLTWRRFATGLHQPLGLKILPRAHTNPPKPGQSAGSASAQSAAPDASANNAVANTHPDEDIYVLGRDQITRLHDLNNDGEADFYENFNNGCKVTTNGHGYATNLETDPQGNFYYLKCADNTNFGGTVIKVSADGKYCEPFAVGLRNPNGLGISPTGFITEADNQGEWVPASRIDFVEPGKFLGYKPSAHDVPAPDMGKPICFMPQNIDNSSGGQIWAPDHSDRWGPFKGDMLHTSYGAARLLHVMMEKVGDTWQGGVTAFPLKFDSGIMRGRFNPKDGQLYVCGLRGWQTAGLHSGAVQRVRYTGQPVLMPKELHTHKNGVTITFPTALDPATANDPGNYSVLRWTYKWTGDYPSRHFSVKDPKKQGYDTVDIQSAHLSKDGKTIFLEIPDIQPVLQQQITINIKAADGAEIHTDIYQTIHNLGPAHAP